MTKVKFLDGISCPRCKLEITYSVNLLQGKEKLICPSCLAEFSPNYTVKQRLKNVVVTSPIDSSTESEELRIDAVDNSVIDTESIENINNLSDISIE